MSRRAAAFGLALACAMLAAPCVRAEGPSRYRDAEDGALDLSDYLLRHRGALPVPIIVTEPAIGYGGGLALAYFSQSFEERAQASRERGESVTPPDISVGFGIKTENGTWAAGAGHMGFWDHDRWRYIGGVGRAELNLDYFTVTGQAAAYRLDATALVQQLVRRVGSADWFAGARYTYISTKSRFTAERPVDVPARDLDTAIGKLGFVVDHDTRDNIFTPNRGSFFEAEAAFARGAFGSDSNYETLYARGYHWQPMGDFVLGVRGDARLSSGDVPFYAQPYIVLRGVPAVRYQDQRALVAETEVRWNLGPRWAAVGFAGVGKAYGRRQSWDAADTVVAGGAGFRYLVARKLNLYAGLDVARGPEDTAIYIQMGSAWR
jgi:surface antigen Omp85-like protein